jgi:hypothetical protein
MDRTSPDSPVQLTATTMCQAIARPAPRPRLQEYAKASLRQQPFQMDARQRDVTLAAIREVCHSKTWRLLTAHVRSNHVHTVVDGNKTPEFIMNALQSYASRALNLLEPT